MRRNLTWFAVVVVFALLETTYLDKVRVFGVSPNLMVLLVVFFGLREGEEWAMFTAVLGGLFQDVAGDTVLGHHVLGLAIIGFIVGKISTRLLTEHPAVKAILVLFSGVGSGLIYTMVKYLQKPMIPFFQLILSDVIPAAFYTALLTPLVFWIVERSVGRFFAPPTVIPE